MFQLYSKSCTYALRALACLPPEESDKNFSIKQLCRKARIPEAYTRKAFQALARAGFLNAVPGPGGGYVLSRAPGRISLLDLVQAIEGKNAFDNCVMGFPKCSCRNPCPVHGTWEANKTALLNSLKNRTLEEIMVLQHKGASS
jgi:Rrf2 family protein